MGNENPLVISIALVTLDGSHGKTISKYFLTCCIPNLLIKLSLSSYLSQPYCLTLEEAKQYVIQVISIMVWYGYLNRVIMHRWLLLLQSFLNISSKIICRKIRKVFDPIVQKGAFNNCVDKRWVGFQQKLQACSLTCKMSTRGE